MRNEYNINSPLGGISKENREKIDIINRKFSEPFEVSDIKNLFGIKRTKASRLLAHWASKGWLTRIRRGLYITVPLGAEDPMTRSEDPWIVANKVFEPCYVGGWSACEHWGLTEQIFDSVVIFTGSKIRNSNLTIQSTNFLLKPLTRNKYFGTKTIWRGRTKIQVSDATRTIVDILNDPLIGGGMRNVADIIKQYFVSEIRNDNLLSEHIKKFKNKTIYKRLGYILETFNIDASDLLRKCKKNLSQGFSLLDPSATDKGKYLRKWNLRINVNIVEIVND